MREGRRAGRAWAGVPLGVVRGVQRRQACTFASLFDLRTVGWRQGERFDARVAWEALAGEAHGPAHQPAFPYGPSPYPSPLHTLPIPDLWGPSSAPPHAAFVALQSEVLSGQVTHVTEVPVGDVVLLWQLPWQDMLAAELAWHKQQAQQGQQAQGQGQLARGSRAGADAAGGQTAAAAAAPQSGPVPADGLYIHRKYRGDDDALMYDIRCRYDTRGPRFGFKIGICLVSPLPLARCVASLRCHIS